MFEKRASKLCRKAQNGQHILLRRAGTGVENYDVWQVLVCVLWFLRESDVSTLA